MKKDNKEIYNRIMESVSKEVKKVLNEEKELTPGEKMDAWHNGERDENIKACGADKLKSYKAICKAKGYDAEVAALDAEIKKRGLKESAIFENEVVAHTFDPEFNEVIEHIKNGTVDTERDSEILFDALVPSSGKADNLGGELLRAAERICYRYFNDGDMAGDGYGRETVNPAVRFMDEKVGSDMMSLRRLVDKFQSFVDTGAGQPIDKEYEEMVMRLLRLTVIYIVNNELWSVPNDEDMLDYKNDEIDVDRDDWEEEDW